jgi:putative aminopeptidase FrvX
MGNSKIGIIRERLGIEYETILADATRFVEHPERVTATYTQLLQNSGLADVKTDAHGNVLGYWKGSGDGRTIVIVVHLPGDSTGTEAPKVRKEDARLFAPGIGDSYSLAVLLSWIRAMKSAEVRTKSDILFVATPNDDAERQLFGNETDPHRFSTSVALEAGAPNDIVNATPEVRRRRPGTDVDPANLQPLPDEVAASTHVSLNLVQLATAVITESGLKPVYQTGISPASVPMRLGIPSIALGCGASGGAPHTTEEWIDIGNETAVRGVTVTLTVLLAVAGLN